MSEVVAEGTVDEKRRLLRALVRKVELDQTMGTGRVEIYDLPLFGTSVQEKKDGPDSHQSSLRVVAGAGVRQPLPTKIPNVPCQTQLGTPRPGSPAGHRHRVPTRRVWRGIGTWTPGSPAF